MAQFDVYRNPGGDGFLLDLQANLLDELSTRVVAPLIPVAKFRRPAKRLNPVFVIARQRCAMATQYMAAVPVRELKDSVANLTGRRDEIVGAVDMLLSGV